MKKFLFTLTLAIIFNSLWATYEKFDPTSTICKTVNGKEHKLKTSTAISSPAASEDDCGSAAIETLFGGTPSVGGTTVGSTNSGTEPNPFGGVIPYGDVWYTYTVPASLVTHIDVTFVTTPITNPPTAIIQMVAACGDGNPLNYTTLLNGITPFKKCVPVMPNQVFFIRISNRDAEKLPFDITINELNIPPATITSTETSGLSPNDGSVCSDVSIRLDAGPIAVGTTYAWNIPVEFPPIVASTQFITRSAIGVAAGTYNFVVTVTDMAGCTSTASYPVTVNSVPSTTLTVTENSGVAPADNGEVCVGDGFLLTATAGFTSYTWSGGASGANAGNTYNVVAATLADDALYRVTVTDINGCTDTELINININANPSSNATTLKVCPGAGGLGNFTLTHAELVPDLVLPRDPAINSNTIADVDNGFAGQTITYHATNADAMADISPLASPYTAPNGTIVFVRVENPITGCYSIASVTLEVNTLAAGVVIQNVLNANSTADFSVCLGKPINLTVDVSGATAPVTYSWDIDGVPFVGAFPIAMAIIATHDGDWGVTVTDGNGCTASDHIIIMVNPLPIPTLVVDEMSGSTDDDGNVCLGDAFTLTAGGGTTYMWSGGASGANTASTYIVPAAVLTDGTTYLVTVTDANFCTATEDIIITINPVPAGSNTTLIACDNGSAMGSFTLNHAELTADILAPYNPAVNSNIVTDIDNGVAGLTVTYHTSALGAADETGIAANGLYANATIIFARIEIPGTECFRVVQVTLQVNSLPTATLIQNVNNANSTINFSVCAGDEIELSVANGTAVLPVTYVWNIDGAPFSGIFPIPTATIAAHDGVWSVTVTDANGCTSSDEITITVNPNPTNNLCSSATPLVDNTAVNGTTACALPYTTTYCGLNTTTSHTVFYEYQVPATNTTNVNLTFTIIGNTATTGTAATNDINIGLFSACSGTVSPSTVDPGDDLCAALGNSVTISCVAPGTLLKIAVGSADGNEGDFSITVDESNAGIPVNDLCSQAIPVVFSSNCEFETVAGTSLNACPEAFPGTCNLNNFPTVWYSATIPAGGIGFAFDNLTGSPNISILSNSCIAPTNFDACITVPTNVTSLAPGTYLIAVRTNAAGGAFGFDIKTIVPPANALCANAVVLSDNTAVNGTTACSNYFSYSIFQIYGSSF
jgi:hypothetical protein